MTSEATMRVHDVQTFQICEFNCDPFLLLNRY